MNPADERDIQVLTSCPACGQMASVAPTEALLPVVCSNCRQIHVANLSSEDATDLDPVAAEELPDEVRAAKYGVIGRYRVTEILGRGAFGVVYKAWDPSLHRWVAIKVPMLAKDRRQRARNFLQEARAAAKLRHPLIVSVFDADQECGQPFIVSEYVEGETLANLLSEATLPQQVAVQIVIELATALAHAHEFGVIHRDVKPSNIIIDPQGRPRLMDFGLAWQPDVASSTLEGPRAGTPGYMPPEQIRGDIDQITAGSDQYSLGVILYESLAGQRLYEGPPAKVLRRILKEKAPPLRSVCPDAPATLEAICARMLSHNPEQRYPDMNRVVQALQEFLTPKVAETPPPIPVAELPPPVVSRPVSSIARIGLIAAGLAVAMVGFGLTMLGRSQGAMPSDSSAAASLITSAPQPADPDGIIGADVLTANADVESVEPQPPVASLNSIPLGDPLTASVTPVATNEGASLPAIGITLPDPADVPAAHSIEQRLASTIPVMVGGEPAADVLAAIAAAEQQRFAALMAPTYPALLPEAGDVQRAVFLQKFNQLLTDAFPAAIPDNEQQYRELSARLLDLQQQYPREPRIPFAMVLLKKLWKAPRNKANELLKDELDLLLQARDAGGYEFTPASLAEIEYWITHDKPQPARDAMLRLVRSMPKNASWPGAAERLRVAGWLGRVYGFYASEISGLPTRDKLFIEIQERLLTEMSVREREAFSLASEGIQSEIQDEIASSEGKGQQLANQSESARQKMLQNLDSQGDLAGKIATEQLENESLDNWLARMQESFRQKFQELDGKSRQLQVTAAPISQRLATVTSQLLLAANNLAQIQATFASDPMADPTLLRTAENQMQLMQQEARLLTQQLKALELQNFELRRQSAILSQQLQAVEGKYLKERKQDAQAIQKLKSDLKKLETEGSTLVAQLKAPQKQVSRDRTQMRKISYWIPRYFDDGPRWLRDSLGNGEVH